MGYEGLCYIWRIFMINKIRPGQRGHAVNGPKRMTSRPLTSRDINPLNLYFRDINKIPLLEKDREIELAKRIERSITLKERDYEAENELINANLGLVISVARSYAGNSHFVLDLIQEGNKGLIRAAKSFDYRKSCRFETHAIYWINQKILKYIGEHSGIIRIPLNKAQIINQLRKISAELFKEKNREPTEHEIADRLDITVDKVRNLLKISPVPLSLETEVGKDKRGEPRNLIEILTDESVPRPDRAALQGLLRQDIDKAMEGLPNREKKVICLFFGLDGNPPETLDDVGKNKDVNLTRERVRQIKTKVLDKLSFNRKLREYRQKSKLK